jgi:septum site-determining protein MinC
MLLEKITPIHQTCFQIKALFSPCTLFQIINYDLTTIDLQLAEKRNLTPNFFQNTPVIIDLSKVATETVSFVKLKQLLLRYSLVPIGIRNASAEQEQSAALVGLPVLQIGKSTMSAPTEPLKADFAETKFISYPIRSGMQIYAKKADLIVTSSVSPGAEVMADGHIHIYGPLRGRAFAGIQGNKEARIFCRHLEAELIAIAGYYLTNEEIKSLPAFAGMVQIYLDQDQIKIETI